jgi:DNA-binding MarR family transcriptional regulator
MKRDDVAQRAWQGIRSLVLDNDRRKAAAQALETSFIRVKALRELRAAPLSMRELAERLASDPPYTTLVVDDLERRGWAERRANPADRRSKLVALTASGEAAAREADRILDEPPAAFGTLDPADLATLDRIVRALLT